MKNTLLTFRSILLFLACAALSGSVVIDVHHPICEKRPIERTQGCLIRPSDIQTHQSVPGKLTNSVDQKLTFDPKKNEWSFSATILQFKDVIYTGAPSQIAMVQYLDRGDGIARQMWIVVSFGGNSWYPDVFRFTDQKLNIGQKVLLTLSGPYVSKSGVNWDKCPLHDAFCHAARRAEGNGPIALDWNNVEIVPTNELIWSGHRTASWWGGALCWKITVLSDGMNSNPIRNSHDSIKSIQK